MTESQDIDFLKCPFCLNRTIESKSDTTICSECFAELEIDDRLECIFVDTQHMKLAPKGCVCGSCGLVQGDENKNCVYCGAELSTTTH